MPPTGMGGTLDRLTAHRALPFALAAVLALLTALIPPSPAPLYLAVAVALTVLVALLVLAFPWARPPGPLSVLPPLTYLLAILVLRDSTGGSGSGFAPLALLPIFWMALYGRRWELVAVIGGVGVLFAMPMIGFLGGDYSTRDIRYTILWVAVSSLVGLTAQALVSRQRRQQRELSQQRDFLDAMFDSAGSLVALLEPDGRVRRINPACERVGGFAGEAIVGRYFWDVLVPPDAVESVARRWRSGDPARLAGVAESAMVSSDGTDHTIHWTLAALHDGAGHVTAFVATGLDVTEERAAREALAESEYRFRTLVRHLPDVAITLYDRDLRCQLVEGPMLTKQGLDPNRLLGVRLDDLLPPDNAAAICEPMERALAGEGSRLEYESHLNETVYEIDVVPYQRDGGTEGALMVSRDITQRKRFERELRDLADRDPLTGLLNRRGFEVELQRHLAHIARYGDAGALLVFDMDGFKAINDTYGHASGDELIVRVAMILAEELRRSDRFARLGGDEFAVLLPEADGGQAAAVAERLVESARLRCGLELADGGWRGCAISLGSVLFDAETHLRPIDCLVAADLAMYEAKRAGGDRFHHLDGATAR